MEFYCLKYECTMMLKAFACFGLDNPYCQVFGSVQQNQSAESNEWVNVLNWACNRFSVN